MNWAWGQKLPPTPKLILMALADSANDADECWPGIPFIAEKCCVAQRTVQRTLQEFVRVGLMKVTPRYTSAGRQTSNGYRLNLAYPDKLSPSHPNSEKQGDILSGTGVTPDVTVEGDIAMSPLEPPDKSQKQPPLLFPHQLSAAERQAVSQMLSDIDCVSAQALLDELADALDSKSIKTNSLRWFRSLTEKQKAGLFIPLGGLRIAESRRHESALRKTEQDNNFQPLNREAALMALAQARRALGIQSSHSVTNSKGKTRNETHNT